MRLLNVRILHFVVAGALILPGGCSLTGRARDQLESNLRHRESTIRDLEQRLATANQHLRDQETELAAVRQSADKSSFHMALASRTLEATLAWGSVHKLRIHSLASGVFRSAEEEMAASVMIQPLDRDGDVVKVAGELSIRLQLPGETSMLSETTMTSLESRSAWSNGFVARGFQIEIPLKADAVAALTADSEILVTATLKLGGDRRFKATQMMRVPE